MSNETIKWSKDEKYGLVALILLGYGAYACGKSKGISTTLDKLVKFQKVSDESKTE